MNLSLNFVKDYIDLDNELSVKDIAEAMTKAGNEYDSAEKLVNDIKELSDEEVELEINEKTTENLNELNINTLEVAKENKQRNRICGRITVTCHGNYIKYQDGTWRISDYFGSIQCIGNQWNEFGQYDADFI